MIKHFLFCLFTCCYAFGFDYYDIEIIKQHIEEKFRTNEVKMWPFPHMIIDNILPDDFYQMILEKWPKDAPFKDNETHTGYEIGKKKDFRILGYSNKESQKFFTSFALEVVNAIIKEEVEKKLLPFLYLRFPCLNSKEIAEIDTNGLCEMYAFNDALIFERDGYSLKAHIDPKEYFATALLYAPEDDEHQELGTVLIVADRVSYDFTYLQDEKIIQRIPVKYLPNRLLVLMQSPTMWHDLPTIHTGSYIRKMYHSQIFINKEKLYDTYKKLSKEHSIYLLPWKQFTLSNLIR